MICKKEVILWFKELESYKRIDMMCTLLNMCLPFELRFLGTCLEELGRRDSQELRGIELRVNSPQDLASDMIACQKGEPTDKKIRRKMALYLALIRASNRSCVTEIFRTLDCWGELEFCSMNDLDTLQELLLVYTMAANHPVFSFDQHMKCTEIFEKIMSNKLVHNEQNIYRPEVQPQSLSGLYLAQHITPTQHDILSQEHTFQGTQISDQGHELQKLSPVVSSQQESVGVNFTHLAKVLSSDASMTHLQTLIRNGFGRYASNQKKSEHLFSHGHQQLPLKQQLTTMSPRNISMNTVFTCPMQNIAVIDGGRESYSSDNCLIEQHPSKSTGSESGSSVGSCGELSPPETPILWQKRSSSLNAVQSSDRTHSYIGQPLNYYNKQIHQARIVERSENKKVAVSGCGSGSGCSTSNSNPRYATSQCNQYTRSAHEMISTLSPGSNVSCKVQSSLANNNIDSKVINIFLDGISSNPSNAISASNIVNTAFASPSSTAESCAILGNTITPKAVNEQSGCSFSYNAIKQNVNAKPHVISHIPEICTQQPQSFRLPASQIPSKTEIICTSHVPAVISPLACGVSDSKKAVGLRTTTSNCMNQSAPNSSHCNGSTPQLQEIIPSNVSQYPASPFSYLTVRNKPISCYNCGSQSHNGRDCTESSMDDVSRNSIYKLDFSVSSSQLVGNYPRPNTNLSENGSNKIQKTSIIEAVETMLMSPTSPTTP